MRRYALKVAYDGTRFAGSQRQPGFRTVEGVLLAALAEIGALQSPEEGRFLVASRTDAGVSAAGNVVAFNTTFRGEALQRAVNAHMEDAWVVGVLEVPEDFHPRKSFRRKYRYHLRRGSFDEAAFREAVMLFEGTHDFTGFARVNEGQDPVRLIQEVRVEAVGPYLNVEFTGPSFLQNQVRRMIAAALQVARGEATRDEVKAVLDRKAHRDFGLAAPEPLVLLDVAYSFSIPTDRRFLQRDWQERREALELHLAVLDDLRELAGGE